MTALSKVQILTFQCLKDKATITIVVAKPEQTDCLIRRQQMNKGVNNDLIGWKSHEINLPLDNGICCVTIMVEGALQLDPSATDTHMIKFSESEPKKQTSIRMALRTTLASTTANIAYAVNGTVIHTVVIKDVHKFLQVPATANANELTYAGCTINESMIIPHDAAANRPEALPSPPRPSSLDDSEDLANPGPTIVSPPQGPSPLPPRTNQVQPSEDERRRVLYTRRAGSSYASQEDYDSASAVSTSHNDHCPPPNMPLSPSAPVAEGLQYPTVASSLNAQLPITPLANNQQPVWHGAYVLTNNPLIAGYMPAPTATQHIPAGGHIPAPPALQNFQQYPPQGSYPGYPIGMPMPMPEPGVTPPIGFIV